MYLHIINFICFVEFCVRFFLNDTQKSKNYGFAHGLTYGFSFYHRKMLHIGVFLLLYTILHWFRYLLSINQLVYIYAILIACGYNLLNRLLINCVIDYIYIYSLGFNLCDVVIISHIPLTLFLT